MLENVHWIALAPLIASSIVLLFGKEGPHSKMPLLSIAAMGYALIHSCLLFLGAVGHEFELPFYRSMEWFNFDVFTMSLGVLIDGPAATMLVVVTLVSFLVQVYSWAYMHGEPRFKRYYAYLSFFTASMLGLVISSNLFVIFCCWELMGVSSYLLIGFWFEKPGPAYASKKAFMTTKAGDMGLYVGLLLLFAATGTFDLKMLQQNASILPVHTATAIGLLFLCGAVGKSAQWPLFIWLPDAMEGPTPVSALIHAATMVAAGIYLVARTYFIYQASPIAMEAVSWIGLITAFMAATMAVVAYDIKRVLAFSTVSQLGYMLAALGAGGYTSGLFHLTTHAFFKALLFLGAGSVIHAVHTNDMRQMGGLSKHMPATFMTMAVATAAIAGFPFTSGFYSKEAVLASLYEHNPIMWGIALFTAALTTFYMCRMMFLTFWNESRDSHKGLHAHESPGIMTTPLWILAILALISGFALEHNHTFAHLAPVPGAKEAAQHPHPSFLLYAAMGALFGGFGLAYKLYGSGSFAAAESLKQQFQPVFNILERRYYFDDLFLKIVDLGDWLAKAAFWIDDKIIDKIFVDMWGLITLLMAEIQNFFDAVFVDGAVDATGGATAYAGKGLRSLMAGQVQEYLLGLALALMFMAIFATLMIL